MALLRLARAKGSGSIEPKPKGDLRALPLLYSRKTPPSNLILELGEQTILFLSNRSLAFLHPGLKNALKARNYLIIPVVHPKTCPRTPTTNERTESGLLENGSLTLLETGLVLTDNSTWRARRQGRNWMNALLKVFLFLIQLLHAIDWCKSFSLCNRYFIKFIETESCLNWINRIEQR